MNKLVPQKHQIQPNILQPYTYIQIWIKQNRIQHVLTKHGGQI